MAPKLTENDLAFRKLVESCEGNLAQVAVVLSIALSSVGARLRTDKHHVWWMTYKTRRSRNRRRIRDRKAYLVWKEKEKAKTLAASADPAGGLIKAMLDNL